MTAAECEATMESRATPDHTHTCSGKHDAYDYHWCPGCRRWWWKFDPEGTP